MIFKLFCFYLFLFCYFCFCFCFLVSKNVRGKPLAGGFEGPSEPYGSVEGMCLGLADI